MSIIIYICLFLLLFAFIYVYIFRSYILRPYKFRFYVGKVGSGKTTLLVKHCLDYCKQCKRKGVQPLIYTNIKINGVPLRLIDPNDLQSDIRLLPGSLVLIDEPNLYWDNRDFKSIPKGVLKWFRLYRHNKVNIVLYSQ